MTALAVKRLFDKACRAFGEVPEDLVQVVNAERELGEKLVADRRFPLVSATGSTRMGRQVAAAVAPRFARTILELGGNNATIVCKTPTLNWRAAQWSSRRPAPRGQRCTSLRRLFVHESVYDALVANLKTAYGRVRVGNPLEAGTLVGPLIDRAAFERMQHALAQAREQGGVVTGGERTALELGEHAY